VTLIVLVVVFAIVFGLLLYGAVWGTNAIIGKAVVEKHRALEEIVSTGKVPRAWSDGRRTSDEKMNRRHLKKVEGLSRYVENSRLIQGEDTRELLLDRLSDLRSRLRERTKG
jgi:hypothetical protein